MDINGAELSGAGSRIQQPGWLGIQSMEVDMSIEDHPDRSTVVVTEERPLLVSMSAVHAVYARTGISMCAVLVELVFLQMGALAAPLYCEQIVLSLYLFQVDGLF